MMKEAVQAGFNAQINMELSAFYTYLSMAAWFENEALPGFAAWMRHHAEEEMVHAMKLLDFVILRRGRVQLAPLAGPSTEWATPLAAFEDAFGHERKVSQAIDALVNLTEREHDRAAVSFLPVVRGSSGLRKKKWSMRPSRNCAASVILGPACIC